MSALLSNVLLCISPKEAIACCISTAEEEGILDRLSCHLNALCATQATGRSRRTGAPRSGAAGRAAAAGARAGGRDRGGGESVGRAAADAVHLLAPRACRAHHGPGGLSVPTPALCSWNQVPPPTVQGSRVVGGLKAPA